jgi:hypothetical protein
MTILSLFLALQFLSIANASQTLMEYLELPARPINAKVSVDDEQKVSIMMTKSAGGTLELTNQNGDHFKLTLPAGALLHDTEISLAPITSFEQTELDFEQTPTGVEISPDGLELLKSATLTITPKTKISIKELAAFTANQAGEDVHLANIDSNGANGPVVLTLLHFSSYSIYGSLSIRESLRASAMSLQKNRIANWVADQLQRQKNGEVIDQDWFKTSLKEWIDRVLVPVTNEVQSCQAGRAAISELLGLDRTTALLGGNLQDMLNNNLTTVLYNRTYHYCYQEAEKACYQDHRPFDVQIAALQAARQSQLLFDSLNPFAVKMMELAEKCLHFEFELHSFMRAGEVNAGMTITAEAKFPVNYNIVGQPIKNTGPIRVTNMTMDTGDTDTVCTLTSLTAPPVDLFIPRLLVADLRFDQSLWVDIGNLVPPSQGNFMCVYTNPDSGEQTSMPISMPPGGGAGSVWGGMFIGTHTLGRFKDYNMKNGMFEPRKWDVLYGDIFATKSYNHKVEEIEERTNLIIYHRPK